MESHARARFARKVLHYWIGKPNGGRSTHPVEDAGGTGYKSLGMTKAQAEEDFNTVTEQITIAAEAIYIEMGTTQG